LTPLIHLFVFASGSKGNSALVQGPEGSVLVDDGISFKALKQRAHEVQAPLSDLKAVLITHEHTDHTKGLRVLSHHFPGPFYATKRTSRASEVLSELPIQILNNREGLDLCGMHVQCFPISHDVVDPIGFRFEVRDGADTVEDALGWCSDTGYLTPPAEQALSGCRILCLESNHDKGMLTHGPYPAILKKRIGGNYGHLSNDQAADALVNLVSDDTRYVVALHLSEENNQPSLCVKTLANAVDAEPVDSTFTEAKTGKLTIEPAAQHRAIKVW
jgi:phosphoribosyl 1,2-cyclic phosphodiesterase